jgi:predicted metal-dependent enzyme (double-stranded beta helix superfamily)
VFNREAFVREIRLASVAADPIGAVQEVVSTAIAAGPSIDAALGTQRKWDNDSLFASADLTVQRIIWLPGIASPPHEHRMWAVVGVYAGEELNRVYERSSGGLEEVRTRVVRVGEVFTLDADAIHSVENPGDEWTAALHVYGGDIENVERNAWDAGGREVPFAVVDAARRAMFEPMGALAKEYAEEYGTPVDSQARKLALIAVSAAAEREQRYLTPDEARRVIATIWKLRP